MKNVVDVLLSRPLLVAVGLIAANALVWFLGPLVRIGEVRPLAGEFARALAITAWGVAAVVWFAARSARSAHRNRRLLDGLVVARPPAPGDAAPGAHDIAEIGRRFEDAVALLKRTRLGGKRSLLTALAGQPYLYQLPWYVIIGAPGAGKTTALANSGLEFPLMAKFGKRGLRGIGGTRNCDWWFTADAVLIDTAGRFTTQDSDREADQAAWFRFLDLLCKYRPRRPINGVLLTVSVSDLLSANRDEQQLHARKLRERVEELYARLRVGIPIYVLVTKLDLLAGFMEFFADFDKDERAQVWGVTFPYAADASQPDPLARMPSELAALEKRLDERLIERLESESDRERRAAIYAFPQQWRVLRETLAEFLKRTFAELQPERRSLVRGIYFTSATQEGTPMDRALGGLARMLGLANRIVAPTRSSGKTFFVTRLLREVVFAEAGLAGSNLRWNRRRVALEWAAIGATAGVVAIALALAWRAYLSNQEYLAAVTARVVALERGVASAKSSEPTDLLALLPVLDSVQAVGRPLGERGEAVALRRWLAMGMDQSAKLVAAGQDAYQRLLKEAFLPRIAVRLEARLRAGGQDRVDTLYEALKAYLMLFGGKNFDRAALRTYLRSDWDVTLPATVSADAGAALRRHFDQLVASGEVGAPVLAERQLIENVRSLIDRVPLAQRAYNRLKGLDLAGPASGTQDFTVESAVGPAAKQVFARASGRSLSQGVPGLYSRAGYQSLQQRSDDVLRQLAAESTWVLGTPASAADKSSPARLRDEIERLYLSDYGRLWDEFLLDIRIVPTADLAHSGQVAQQLARTDSPLLALLTAAAREVNLDPPQPAGVAQSLATGGTSNLLGDRFDALRRFAAGPPLQEVLALLGKLSSHLAAVDDAARRKVAAPASNVTHELAALASRTPEPVHGMLAQLAAASAGQIFVTRRDQLGRQLASELGAPCMRALQGRYPLVRASTEELSREEFERAFATGGLIDEFFQRNLAPFVDTTARAWTLPTADGRAEPAESLQQFQRARMIRDAFFHDGGRKLGVRFEFKLLELDPGVNGFELEVDGQTMRFARDTRNAISVQWPAAGTDSAAQRVRLGFTTATPGSGARHSFEGPWALLRLFERVRVEPGASADRMRIVFDVEGRRAQFEVKSASPINPIHLAALEQFQCPQKL